MARTLKREGFRFCGPTTVYAFMQSVGMVNDHLVTCPRHADCAELARSFVAPKA
jgi:DNA-3-methyladenine glycosylase I